jgi:glycosyltransferase involved in cell wall biosynthesis
MPPPAPARPVRVLVNGVHARTGGGVTYLRNVVPGLAGDPSLSLVVLLHESQRDLFPNLGAWAETVYVDFSDGFYGRLLWEQAALPHLARRLKADVTFSPANFGPLLAPRPVVLLRNALAVAAADPRPTKRLYWAALTAMTRLSLLRAPAAMAVSDYARRTLTEGLPAAVRARVRVVPHGVSDIFRPDPEDRPREDFALAVGDIYVQKNLLGLIEALARARKVLPGLRLKVAGRPVDADYAARCRALAAARGLEGVVVFLGHVPAEGLVDLYRRCRLFVFPSLIETFGHPLLEALACGAPVASSNATAMPEVAGDAALYFDPADPEAMADCLVRLARDDTLRAALSAKAAVRAAAFSWEVTARRTAEVLKAAAGVG